LRHRRRIAASAYLEAFVLIGIAAGGCVAVLTDMLPYASVIQGPAVAVEDAAIRQGAYVALERLTVVNSGQTPVSSFTVSTSQASPSAVYCYALYDLATGMRVVCTCPGTASDPATVTIPYSLPSGGAVGVVITIMGAAFTIGVQCMLTVTTSTGAQQTVGVQVASA